MPATTAAGASDAMMCGYKVPGDGALWPAGRHHDSLPNPESMSRHRGLFRIAPHRRQSRLRDESWRHQMVHCSVEQGHHIGMTRVAGIVEPHESLPCGEEPEPCPYGSL